LLRQGHRVYVHCTAGINRSPRVVLTYLTGVEGMGLEETMTLLPRARPEAFVRRGRRITGAGRI
jgi:protein-tyrosine phosphatase